MKRTTEAKTVFHLLPNAHLDPVWLWDWREGLNEGVITVRTILDLMDEFPDLTFIRGESAIYQHIEQTDPATFERIRAMVKQGRWDIVGGTYIQPDTNLAATETLCRQFETGLGYFRSRFNFTPRIAWLADSFGHTPGLPNILSAFGMEGFMFTRPNRSDFPLPEPAFWWQGDHGNRVLAYRQHYGAYCSEPHNLPFILDLTLNESRPFPLRNVAVLMGLGNHGGGPSRKHIADAREWAARHPEIELRFSTFHRFFDALRGEISGGKFQPPAVRGDLGFCLRGCYSSVAKFKTAYRHAEALLPEAEAAQTFVNRHLNLPAAAPLAEAWDGLLFNAFHDILPGTSLERALDEQLSWVGQTAHTAQAARFHALNRLAAAADTRVRPAPRNLPAEVPLLVWNPLPRPVNAWVELEACLDYRPDFAVPARVGSLPLTVSGPKGERPAFQEIPTEHHSMRDGAWRKRVLLQTELPACGWKVFRLGRAEKAAAARDVANPCRASLGKNPAIHNKNFKVQATASGVKILFNNQPLFGKTGLLQVQTFADLEGSWGDMRQLQNPPPPDELLETWKLTRHAVRQSGPQQAVLWTRWQGGHSWLELTFTLRRDARAVAVAGRALWNERSARLKLTFPSGGALDMQVPASQIRRAQPGHLPCGRWFRRDFGFVSDMLSDLDAAPDRVRVTVARASRYADDVPTRPDERPWLPAVDCGELKFNCLLAPRNEDLELLAEELLHPPVTLTTPPHDGPLGVSGSLAELKPAAVALLAAATDADGRLRLRLQNRGAKPVAPALTLSGKPVRLPKLQPGEIKTLTVK